MMTFPALARWDCVNVIHALYVNENSSAQILVVPKPHWQTPLLTRWQIT